MNKNIKNLNPQMLWQFFYEITQIPRPSKKEQAITEYVMEFGRKYNLTTEKDETGNVIIRKSATLGFENTKGVILQAHLDMVPQKNNDKIFDFETDAIEAYTDGDWVKANGTTLGADNGIGLAAILAIFASDDIQHGPLEALLTVDEETGMTGAFGLKAGVLNGEILINLDSEDEGEIFVGCAGGLNANVDLPYSTELVPAGMHACKLSISGLKGGHSGVDIIRGRGNANILLFRFLKAAAKNLGLRISSIDGGGLRNAIPREASAVIVAPIDNMQQLANYIETYKNIYISELGAVEPDLDFYCSEVELPEYMFTPSSQSKLINAVNACPNGVIRMSDSMPGLVETSTNLAKIETLDGTTKILFLLRSSVDSAKEYLSERISSVFELAGTKIVFSGNYPGWKPDMASSVLKTFQKVYADLFGKQPAIAAIHAGLECGLFSGMYPHLDLISCGPTIRFPHSPDEKVHIESVDKFWKLLVSVLKNIEQKQFN